MILTRKEYCKAQLTRMLEKEYSIKDGSLDELTPDMIQQIAMSSSTYGICLEELGYINETNYPVLSLYLSCRGGVFATYCEPSNSSESDEPIIKIMTFREFLNLLPND